MVNAVALVLLLGIIAVVLILLVVGLSRIR
jgi:hypothetical protein